VPYTLLLADDSVTIQRVIELTFADEDILVTAVSDGEQAIQRLEAAPPDIVLADIGMPGRNGYEVAQYVKQSPRLAHIPVVLLTGAFEPVDQARASEAGCDGVLAKPFEPQLVIGRVKDLLARPRPVTAAANAPDAPASPPNAFTPAPIPAPAPSVPTPARTAPVALDAYFDRLDAAFSNLSAAPASTAATSPPATPVALPVSEEIDWFGAAKTETTAPPPELDLPGPQAMDERPDLPLSGPVAQVPEPEPAPGVAAAAIGSEQPAAPAAVEAAPVVQPVAAAPAAQPLVPIHQMPTLADAFAVLLAAEKGETVPPTTLWPVGGPSASLAEDIVERVTKRVIAELSDRVVREMAADVVSAIAERLIREEIERIKAALQ
jgi:CheY-like chemotaxis protein